MSLIDLFSGVAVVVDDEVKDEGANITLILNQLRERSIPIVEFDALPAEAYLTNMRALSFLLLDWRLVSAEAAEVEEGVAIPAGIAEFSYEENIEFIKKVSESCFCPIFIFTNEDLTEVCAKLENAGLYDASRPGRILVRNKADLASPEKFADEIESWLKINPSMYVLKEWEREYQKSKDELFSDFHNLSPRWSKVMWDNFGADGANRSLELGELISKNLHTRMSPFEFENEILGIIVDDINSDELRRVLQGEKYLSNDKLQSENLSPGDVFKKKGKYYLNIRAGCDLIPDRSTAVTSLDDVELYLIGGNKLTVDKEQEHFLHSHGAFSEKDSQAIVFPIDDYCTVDFRFKRLKIVKWSDWKTRRIGRLLPPYINRIQQRFGLFVQRQALPRTPSSSLDRS